MKGMCFFALKLIFNFFLIVLSDNMSETNKQTPNMDEYPDYPSANLVVSEERSSMTWTEQLETSQERELRLWKAESHDKICKEIKKLRGKYIDPLLRAQRAGILWDETDQVAPLTAGALASILQDDEEEERRAAAEQEKYSGYGEEEVLEFAPFSESPATVPGLFEEQGDPPWFPAGVEQPLVTMQRLNPCW